MKNKNETMVRKICAAALAAAMLTGTGITAGYGALIKTDVTVNAAESATPASSFEYTENSNGTVTITKFKGSETAVVIPSKINNKNVTGIGDEAFTGSFDVVSISVPASVTSIGATAFIGCNSLKTISVDSGNTKYSSDSGVLFDKSKTEIIRVPSAKSGTYIIPNTVKTVASYAFWGCTELTEVTVQNGVTTIGYSAFWNCSALKSIVLPSSVTTINDSAFAYCSALASITVPNSIKTFGSDVLKGTAWYDSQNNGLLYVNNIAYGYKGTMPSNASFTLKDSTTVIAGSAFASYSGLAKLTIPNSVTSIGSLAFENCTSLTSIVIPEGVAKIEDDTFSGCTKLAEVTIPESVKTIGVRAFFNCSALKNITIPSTVTSIGSYAFVKPVTITGKTGSAAETYAKNNSLTFIPIKDARLLGDVNGDGKVNIADALLISRYDAGLASLDAEQLAAGDVNKDNKVNIADALLISRYDAGLIAGF